MNMDGLFDKVALIQQCFSSIQSIERFTESKTTSCKWLS